MLATTRKLNTLNKRVEYCLERFDEARNSDIELFARLCESFYPPFTRPIHNWRDMAYTMHTVPTLDNVARARRKVIQMHRYTKFLPTIKSVADNRAINARVWRNYMINNKLPIESDPVL